MGPSGGIGSCCRRSRTAFASHSRCWEYWSVFELTPPSAGLEAGRCRFRGEGGRIRIRDQPHAPSTTQRRMVLRSWMNTPCAGLKQVRRVEKPSNGMPRICWQTIFICGKPQWYGKPLKQRGLLSRQADIRRVTCASRVAGVRQAIRRYERYCHPERGQANGLSFRTLPQVRLLGSAGVPVAGINQPRRLLTRIIPRSRCSTTGRSAAGGLNWVPYWR